MATETLLQEALALPTEERARIAEALLRSLAPDDPASLSGVEWEQAWDQEIERRVRDLDEGRTTPISYEEFQRRVRARLPQP